MRSQAHIERIAWKKDIENADNIELAGVLGWQCVTGKSNNFNVGDLVIYIEIDSILPSSKNDDGTYVWPEFDFMESRKFRVKTIKLKGQLSQGLIMPVSILLDRGLVNQEELTEGLDVSELLNIFKYELEIPLNLRGLLKGSFPIHLFPKTDEIRIQNIPNILDHYRNSGITFFATEKLDGTSCTFYVNNDEKGVCGRNVEFKLEGNENNLYVKMFNKYFVNNIALDLLNKNIALQGEICGPGIQKNPIGLKSIDFYCYNVYFIDEKRYANFTEWLDICLKLGVPTVPIYSYNSCLDGYSVETLLESVNNLHYSIGAKNLAEGLVFRSYNELYCPILEGRLSFKVINNNYLLKS